VYVEERELVIIGGGPGGMAAAIYAKRAGLDTVLIEKSAYGGQILITHDVENWPGVKQTTGAALSESFREHAEHLGCEFRKALVKGIEPGEKSHIVHTDTGDIRAKAVIIATGASFRRLGCKAAAELIGSGVSFCAVCDGPFFTGEEVAVIGGGNIRFYNTERFQKRLGQLSPVEYREKLAA